MMVKPAKDDAVKGDEPAVEFFDGVLDGSILEEADPMRIVGFPMESLFYADEYDLLLGAIQLLPADEKLKYASKRVHSLGQGELTLLLHRYWRSRQVSHASPEAS
jgi:hypothetical protein